MDTSPVMTAPLIQSHTGTMTATPQMIDSMNLSMIQGTSQAAGLPNPDDSHIDLLRMMAPSRTAAPQMADLKIMEDISMVDSEMSKNGKGMGSGSGRPLPSTHLDDGVI